MINILKTNSRKLIIFEIICVLAIIGIIGYTYSFFNVTVSNSSVIYGEAASVNLSLTVTKVSPSDTKGLIPQLDNYITSAVIGRKGSCVDDNNNNVCQVYKITLKNSGSSSVFVTGTLTLNANNNPNLKWAEITDTTEPELKSNVNQNTYTLLTSNEFYNVNEEKNYYIVLWISETGGIQTDNGKFSGTVKFENTDGVSLPAETLEEVTIRQEATSNFLSSNIARQDIESIEFIKKSDLPSGVSNPIDVTYNRTNNANSVQLYSILNNETSKYKIYITSESGTIYLKSGYRLFENLINMTSIDLTNVDTSRVTDMTGMFDYCQSLTSLDLSNFDTSSVTLMTAMFQQCEKLTTLNISNFNTSKVMNMSYIFRYCSKLASLNLNNFNTSNVTTMYMMFYNCASLLSLDVSSFDTSNVTNMSYMFNKCQLLINLDLSSFNTSNVTTMHGMFSECKSLTSLDLSNFNTSNVINMYGMFGECELLTNLYLNSWNTSNVTNMSYMFNNCQSLTNLDLSNFDTSKVTTMQQMFNKCQSLTNLDLSSFNTSNVTTMYGMFSECKSLTSLDLSSFDTSKVTNMAYMFEGSGTTMNLNKIYVSNKFVTTQVTNSINMFSDCTNLVGGNGTVFDSNNIDKAYARIDSSSNPGYFTLKV